MNWFYFGFMFLNGDFTENRYAVFSTEIVFILKSGNLQ